MFERLKKVAFGGWRKEKPVDVSNVPETGWYWHVYHCELLSWCYGYQERRAYIECWKPKNERSTRLRLLQPVRGELPKELLDAQDKGRAGFDLRRIIRENMLAIKKLHDKECPNCPWDFELDIIDFRNIV